ncbi:putative endonuclease [Seinonella peptonophila]|uniref:UPF0102 protein SAMN05444392_1024 n=1 Tax=Seinonella peptonophila TaxID=112248 RepID=A0A1M4USL9_9BACL|nr:YraN family protein [Seinonella peptonophila]SHE59613.1 putative endonuclease [Seinonella peptonophila]
MTKQRKAIGRYGETLAASHLEKLGYQVIERNWTSRLGELDIIAISDNQVIICEVRTTTQTYFGYGFQSVDRKKQQKLQRLALQYVAEKGWSHLNIRMDVISVLLDGQRNLVDLKHIQGI